ncbi:MAG: YihY/virulence factor BrkB family protein [Ferruginibacter sp.]
MNKITWKGIRKIFKNSFKGFTDHHVTKLSGSLAYSTVFSMAPLLIIIISLCSIFFGREAVEGKIYEQLTGFLGSDTALQLQQIIKNASLNGKSQLAMIIGIITLLIGSTAIFSEIQDSINTIWGLKPKPKKGWLKMLQNRFLSFSIIISLGFLLLVSLSLSSLIEAFSNKLKVHFPEITVITLYIINNILTLLVTTTIFAVIFKVLPDATIRTRDVIIGALVTALFFMLGKFALSFYISKSNVGSTYGTAGSLVILLLWIYYSSLILYFGAEVTKSYAVEYGSEIYPNRYAVTTKTVEVESVGQSVQEKEHTSIKVKEQ